MLIPILATMNALLLTGTALVLFRSASQERQRAMQLAEQRLAENTALGERLERLHGLCQDNERMQRRLEYLLQHATEHSVGSKDATLAQSILESGGSAAALNAATELNPAEIDLMLRLQAAKANGKAADIH